MNVPEKNSYFTLEHEIMTYFFLFSLTLFFLIVRYELTSRENFVHVIDGGFLLHKVIWQKNNTMEEIRETYYDYVEKHDAANSFIIFDGYPDADNQNPCASSTKTIERLRRKTTSSTPNFKIELQRKVPYPQEKFLSNEHNKNELIKVLSQKFKDEGYTCKQAEEDADPLIITTAIEISKTGKNVIVVGQDIDLLVLLNQLGSNQSNLYFLKPATGRSQDVIYSSQSFMFQDLKLDEDNQSIVAFLHCFTGCDTTSAFAGRGKKTSFMSLTKIPDLLQLVKPFYKENADPTVIAKNGCEIIKYIYINVKVL